MSSCRLQTGPTLTEMDYEGEVSTSYSTAQQHSVGMEVRLAWLRGALSTHTLSQGTVPFI
jgi:hypothetical protein